MKTFLILFLFSALCCVQCHKIILISPVLTGKLIVNGPCDHYVIQIQKGATDTANIQSSWNNPADGTTYANVFTVANYCSFGNYGLQKGDVFTFKVDNNQPAQECPICEIFVPTPSKQNSVINVAKVN